MIFIEPDAVHAARQLYGVSSTAPLRGVQHPYARPVMAALQGFEPVPLWRVINAVARATQPVDRDQRRFRQLSTWRAIQELLRVKLLFRHRGYIARQDFSFARRPRNRRRLSASAPKSLCQKPGSNGSATATELTANNAKNIAAQVVSSSSTSKPIPAKTQTVRPRDEVAIRHAASVLARGQRGAKRWSGWIGNTRTYRKMEINLPDGTPAYVYGSLRGQVIWTKEPGWFNATVEETGVTWGVLPADRVTLVKSGAASMLGRLKAGVKERASRAKADSARRNGCLPVRPGSRPRGRPRKLIAAP